MKKVLIVGSQHGDELLGIRLYEVFKEQHPDLRPFITYLCGNPQAFAKNVRYIETDLNRSYSQDKVPISYEEQRARYILNYVEKQKFDYILDIHTSTTKVGCCLITPDATGAHQSIIAASTLKNILVMPPQIANLALIGHTDNSISLECNEEYAKKPTVIHDLSIMLERLITEQAPNKSKRSLYYISGFIEKDFHADVELKNFQEYQDRVPVLVGGKKGRTYKGFWAEPPKELII